MSITMDDLVTFYQQTVARRAAEAVAVPDPTTPLGYAEQAMGLITTRDAVVIVVSHLLDTARDLETRLAALEAEKGTVHATVGTGSGEL